MGVFGPGWSLIHQKKSTGLLTPILAFLSVCYEAGLRIRLSAYRRGIFKRESLPGFTVSIGNLTTGGTGKTPAVIMLARWAQKEGFRVAVLSRGYGGRYKDDVLEVSDGNSTKTDANKAGDEPFLLARRLSGIPVVISKKRFKAGLYAHEKYGCDFFILDDGFQHLKLKRDLDLALIDAASPFGNGHLLPWGPLRESVDKLGRADAFVITRSSRQGAGERLSNILTKKFPSTPVYYEDHLVEKVVFPFNKEILDPEFLGGRRIVAFAGIARPEVFKNTLIGLGSDVVHFMGFRDHHRFGRDEIEALVDVKEKLEAEYILTTEKDWVRMSAFSSLCPEMGYLRIRFTLLSGQDNFFQMIKNGIDQKNISDTDI